jgi:signal transduction histidine kinase
MFLVFLAISIVFANWAVNPVKRAVEKQNRFVADASHELKTPLTVVLANAELLSASPEATVAEKQKQIDHIKSEAGNMSMLVHDMLTLAKSDFSKKKKIKYSPVNASEILNSVVLAFEAPVFESGKKLKSEIADSLYIGGDEKALERLFYILLDNAVKYSNEGGDIDVFLYEAAGKVNLTVRNSGLPIPKEHLTHIFDRFYRPDDARARRYGGFGLGLSIAKDTVEKHGGKISVESSDEIGTAFNVSFKKLSS